MPKICNVKDNFAKLCSHIALRCSFEPNRAAWHCNLGNLWQQLDDQDQAIACYEQALQIDAGCIPARQNLGYLLFNHGRTEEAVAQYDALVKLNASPINRLLAASVLPVVYESKAAVGVWRRRLIDGLDALIADGGTVDATESLVPTSFFLAYQGLNDADVMRRLGKICPGSELVTAKFGKLKQRSDGRLRIGFLSAYFRDHTIGRLNLGRIQHLNRTRFEVTVLSATGREDSVTTQFRAAADRYRQIPRDVKAARAAIADQDLDVLIFADVGMDSLTATLAWSRMAPVQCVTWGHPDTTGSPFIDYFLVERTAGNSGRRLSLYRTARASAAARNVLRTSLSLNQKSKIINRHFTPTSARKRCSNSIPTLTKCWREFLAAIRRPRSYCSKAACRTGRIV